MNIETSRTSLIPHYQHQTRKEIDDSIYELLSFYLRDASSSLPPSTTKQPYVKRNQRQKKSAWLDTMSRHNNNNNRELNLLEKNTLKNMSIPPLIYHDRRSPTTVKKGRNKSVSFSEIVTVIPWSSKQQQQADVDDDEFVDALEEFTL
ncbi:uncharacterized protein BX663DRAFT_505472 [Cokeromyces recurvatus]|uniref:uncharacterized protein n=1 Tax=Cokeromyces recurvatus TaxID=90255 RepID=UPI00221FEB7C|nr:uncharacterized protein BX663DRAFT_505472 [Cokeromyces recurvatus]KAI7903854.1 hypothetical protein BX663DRAFT_505472 [Cokeromyces recurvatus]